MARSAPRTTTQRLTCVIERESSRKSSGYVALCPELDIASQGRTIEQARVNLVEALELFFETASPSEVKRRLSTELYITPIEVRVG